MIKSVLGIILNDPHFCSLLDRDLMHTGHNRAFLGLLKNTLWLAACTFQQCVRPFSWSLCFFLCVLQTFLLILWRRQQWSRGLRKGTCRATQPGEAQGRLESWDLSRWKACNSLRWAFWSTWPIKWPELGIWWPWREDPTMSNNLFRPCLSPPRSHCRCPPSTHIEQRLWRTASSTSTLLPLSSSHQFLVRFSPQNA